MFRRVIKGTTSSYEEYVFNSLADALLKARELGGVFGPKQMKELRRKKAAVSAENTESQVWVLLDE